jgi:hypothetical protein
MDVDTLWRGFIIEMEINHLKERQKSLERALEEAVSRALRDNLAPLQRTADELHQAYGDLVAACSSSRPSNALPAMLRAQTAASALAAGLSVLSNFVAVALNPRDGRSGGAYAEAGTGTAVEEAEEAEDAAEAQVMTPAAAAAPARKPSTGRAPAVAEAEPESEWAEAAAHASAPAPTAAPALHEETPLVDAAAVAEAEEKAVAQAATEAAEATQTPAFDIASLSSDVQDLHRRANRVAKVAMQDIKLLRPKDVRLGRENKDICQRLRSDLDKARKEYDRRFRSILDHPVDYFHHWLVEILAEGNSEAVGEYPYPSPVLRH